MGQELFDWALLIGRWVHITVGVTWIGTSIFFMWLDRTLRVNAQAKHEGHVGELWMVHGGGFYHVEKLLMGPTKVPSTLHWFKWESYWTWMSGAFLVASIFYTGGGTFLLDDSVSNITYVQGVLLGIFSLIGSWFFYDTLWERKLTRDKPLIGHILTMVWFVGMSYILCHTLSGRAAYIHIGGMLGTWMTANVFMRIIPRQLKMVEASKKGEAVNQDWGKNAKNRSTHNTYFTLPVIFIMLSNHFPTTYGHDLNWVVLLLISAAGAAIREYFVVRLDKPARSKKFAAVGIILLIFTIGFTSESFNEESDSSPVEAATKPNLPVIPETSSVTSEPTFPISTSTLRGIITFKGKVPKGKKLRLPRACEKMHRGPLYARDFMIKNGKLQNVLVRVTKGLEAMTFTKIPSEPLVMDQVGCVYVPRVAVARVGQDVKFKNSDPLFHNVKSITKKNKKFNIAMPKNSKDKIKIFKNPEMMVQTKCSVHPWMGAYIAVVDHPFYSVSNEKGEVELKDLPHGQYTVEFWHEKFGVQTREVAVNGLSDSALNFEFTSFMKKKK